MRPHHQRVVDRLIETFRDDPHYPALIVGGSAAKGLEREDSDVDIMLVATDEEYARREAAGSFWYFNRDLCDYSNGYVDGKIISMGFLHEVAAKGSEPARWAFVGAFPAYSRIPGLESLLARIPVYQESERQRKIESFYSQVSIMNWFVGEAEKRDDTYLMMHVISNMVLFGGRLILAHNRILYPYHKWFLHEVERAPEKPENFMMLIDQLLKRPCQENAKAFLDSIKAFQDWGVTPEQTVTRFMYDSEWAWRCGPPPIQDW
jgi:predicted nucleotidyltransferase